MDKRKTIALGLGIVFSFVATEASLWWIGSSHRLKDVARIPSARRGLVILCLGNSYTAGIGADPGHAYPDHLQRMIDGMRLPTPVQVINEGRANLNTTLILERLPEQITRYQPDVVVLMAGEPNEWNKDGYDRFLARHPSEQQEEGKSAVGAGLRQQLQKSRTFRLGSYLFYRWSQRFSDLLPRQNSRMFPEQPLSDQKTLALRWIGELSSYNLLNVNKLTREQALEATRALQAYIDQSGASRDAFNSLARLHAVALKDFDRAVLWYTRAIESDPGTFNFEAYFEIESVLPGLYDDGSQRTQEIQLLRELAGRNHPVDRIYPELRDWFIKERLPRSGDRIEFLRTALKMFPSHIKTYRRLYREYRSIRNEDLAAQVLIEALRANPYGYKSDLFNELHFMSEIASPATRQRIARFQSEFAERHPTEAYRALPATRDSISRWIRTDLKEISRLLKSHRIPLVLQTYAPLRGGSQRLADKLIPEVAFEENLPVADNFNAFSSLQDSDSHYTDQFGPLDSHQNSKGYALMASILLDTLKKEKLLPN